MNQAPPSTGASTIEALEARLTAAVKENSSDVAAVEADAIAFARALDTSSGAVQFGLLHEAGRFMYLSGRAMHAKLVAEEGVRACVRLGWEADKQRFMNIVGVCNMDTGNYPGAMEAFANALTLCRAVGDFATSLKVWQNICSTLMYCGMYHEAEEVVRFIANTQATSTNVPNIEKQTLHNHKALIALHLGRIPEGLVSVAAAKAIAAALPDSPHAWLNQTLTANYHCRLLIEQSDYIGAMQQAKEARRFAELSGSPRADVNAAVAEGLAMAFLGHSDDGIRLLVDSIERANARKQTVKESYKTLIRALEHAGRNEEALVYLKEMMRDQRAVAEANVLLHVREHLQQLHASDADSPSEDVGDVIRRMEMQAEVLEGRVAKAEVMRQKQELFAARVEAMEQLAVGAELHDDASGEHSYRVGRIACLLAKEAGCDDPTIAMIDIAARMHDVGKLGIPDHVLLKRGALNSAERTVMEKHSEIGADILAKSEIPHIKMAEEIARHHHERWDGSGYPAKLAGQAIPLAARITALAEVYDAITHDRVYREAKTIDEALSEILLLRGRHFDPELTDLFLAMMSRLRREHQILDYHFGKAARASTFLQARGKIWDTLALAKDEYQQQFQRAVDLQR